MSAERCPTPSLDVTMHDPKGVELFDIALRRSLQTAK